MSSTSPRNSSRPLCQFYVRYGACRYGSTCRFSHDLNGLTRSEALNTIPCPYFQRGNCHFGSSCQLKHSPPQSQDEEVCCGICLENTSALHRQFGILSCCNHVFCHRCIMEWRTEGSAEVSSRRVCPTCRKESDFVVPSHVHPTSEEEKNEILRHYKERLATIPCRNFDGELGSCPFGSDCFYAHCDGDGKDVKSRDRTMQQLFEERQHQRNSRRGRHDLEMISEMLLMMGMQRHLAGETNGRRRRGQRDRRNRGRNASEDDNHSDDDGDMDAIDFMNHLMRHFLGVPFHGESEDDEDSESDSSMSGLEDLPNRRPQRQANDDDSDGSMPELEDLPSRHSQNE